jgi:hypothetical protein
VLESDAGAGRQVGGRARARDELGQAGDVVRLHVSLEDRHDQRPQRCRGREIAVDEVGVRVDDRELGVRAATEQVAGARSTSFRNGRSNIAVSSFSARFDRQARAPPLRKADVQAASLQPARSEQPDSVVGIDAVGAAAVGDDLPAARQLGRK